MLLFLLQVLWPLHMVSPQVNGTSYGASEAPRARVPTGRKWELLALGWDQVWHHIHHIVLAKVSAVPHRFKGGPEMLPLQGKQVKHYVAIFNLPYWPFSFKLALLYTLF